MIISASRRTDIPAFYSDWFMNRIRAGYCTVANPFNRNQISRVALGPQDVDVIVFWTRNPRPLFRHLDELDQRVCPSCGITFKEFRAQGRLGCPHDYIAFEDELLPLLENIHGETEHCGKIPKRAPDSSQQQFRLIKLRSELRSAVDEERYEDAARIRDEIKHVETRPPGAELPPESS
mgnify:CR=1 FL=1